MSEGQELTPKQRLIEFKGKQGKVQTVNLNNLEAIFANVEKHNAEFSMGAMLAKGLSSHIRDQVDDETSKPFSSEKDKRDTFGEILEILHADSLSPIGISFTTSNKGATLITGDEEIAETQVEFAIQNPDLFLSFLDGLSQSRKDLGNEKISAMLNSIGLDTTLQIWRNYRFIGDSKDERIELIAVRLGKLVSKFKGLGIKTRWDDRSVDLDDYVKYAEKGILKEYIAADSADFFAKPNDEKKSYATLANWRNDISLESVQEKWEKAISILEQLKSNPKAKELLQEVKTNLADCVNAALQDIDSKDHSWDKENEWVKRKEKKEIFENARINLQMM